MQPSSNKFAVPYRPEAVGQQRLSSGPASTRATTLPVLVATTRSSPCYTLYVVTIHAVALLAVWLPDGLPWLVSLAAVPAILFNARQMLGDFPDNSTLHWHSNGQITIKLDGTEPGRSWSGTVLPGSMQCYFCVLLQINIHGNRDIRFLVPRDAVSARDYRRLRSRLYLAARIRRDWQAVPADTQHEPRNRRDGTMV